MALLLANGSMSTNTSGEGFQKWKRGDGYEDEAGFCRSATIGEVAKHDHVITPGRYVAAADEEDDGEAFGEKMARLTGDLKEQLQQSKALEAKIAANLQSIGHGL